MCCGKEGKRGAKYDRGCTRRLRPVGVRFMEEDENAPSRSTPKEKRKRKTTASVLEGFAPGGLAQGGKGAYYLETDRFLGK